MVLAPHPTLNLKLPPQPADAQSPYVDSYDSDDGQAGRDETWGTIEEVWASLASTAKGYVHLLHRAERLRELETGPSAILAANYGADWVDHGIAQLRTGAATRHDIERFKRLLGIAEQAHALPRYRQGEGA